MKNSEVLPGVLSRIPFNRPHLTGSEPALMLDAINRGHISGDGFYTRRCHEELRRITGSGHVLLTTSCTHALEMSALLLGVGPGDEVIMPSFTFVSTANAFTLRGATPVFVDVRPDTLNIDEQLIESAVTPQTKAIVVVHYAGVACEMDEICAIAERHGLAVVEDNAHGLGGTYHGRALGSMGTLATQSFHETKNIQCGEGGALLINDPSLAARAEIIREKGTNRSQFFRGEVDKYTWVDQGSSYLPSDLLAAYLLAQLERFREIQARRMEIWNQYDASLADWCANRGFSRPTVPSHCEHPAHLYYLLVDDADQRAAIMRHLNDRQVLAVFHYVPLHSSPEGRRLAPDASCPVTEAISERLVRLPLYVDLTAEDQERVIDALMSF